MSGSRRAAARRHAASALAGCLAMATLPGSWPAWAGPVPPGTGRPPPAAIAPTAPRATQTPACVDAASGSSGAVPTAPEGDPVDPAAAGVSVATLTQLLAAAERRSQLLGAARLLAEAAERDVDESTAARRPSASLNAGLADVGGGTATYGSASGVQLRGGVSLSAPLYDAGRLDAQIAARGQLAEAARQARLSAGEQVALQTVSLAIERSRYGAIVQVWEQYRQQVACLVGALETIVAADRGRGSELVQARKSLQQVSLSREDAVAQLRQVETQLKGLVGPELPPLAPLAGVLATPPARDVALADAVQAPDILQLARQAEAQDSTALATAASQKTQASWVASGTRVIGTGSTGNNWNWSAGVQLSVPLLDPGAKHTLEAARQRALAARLQHDDALEARQTRIATADEQRAAAITRASRIVEVLGNSEQVRRDTVLQWQLLGRRSLFDVMAAEGDHYGLRLARLNALHDAEQAAATIWSLGRGVQQALR